jgi:hypothetical protein
VKTGSVLSRRYLRIPGRYWRLSAEQKVATWMGFCPFCGFCSMRICLFYITKRCDSPEISVLFCFSWFSSAFLGTGLQAKQYLYHNTEYMNICVFLHICACPIVPKVDACKYWQPSRSRDPQFQRPIQSNSCLTHPILSK